MDKEIEEKLNQMFPHFAGYDDIRLEMAQLIDLVKNHDLYAKKVIHFPRGWLLYGDPGTGKTRLVKDIIDYLGIPHVEISASNAVWKKMTNEEEIRQGFEEAKKYDLAVLFIDEIEKLAGYNRFEYDVPENLKAQKVLLHELDEVYEKDSIIVIATCNHLDYLGDALSRSGRFDRQILFDKPILRDRKAILAHFLKKVSLEKGVTIDELARMTQYCSGSDLEAIVNEASIKSVSERRDAVSLNDFSQAINRVQLDDVPHTLECDEERRKVVAYHEAGHAYMMYRLMKNRVGTVTIYRQGKTEGVTKNLEGQDIQITSLQDLKNACEISLGGLVAVKEITGEYYCGNAGDLDSVCKMVERMMGEGFYGPRYLKIAQKDYSYGPFSTNLMNDMQQKGAEILQDLMDQAKKIVREGKESIMALAEALVEKSSLLSEEVVRIFDESAKNRT